MRHIFCAFLLLFYTVLATAEDRSYLQLNSSLEHKSYLAQTFFSGEIVQVKLDNFLSVPNSDLSQTQDLFFAIESMRTFKFNAMTSRWNLGSRYSNLEGLQYWVRELNTQFSQKLPALQSQFGLSIGRMYFTDLKLDSLWGLGVVEPQFRGDPLNPIHQGLTGVSGWMDLGGVKFSIFASPLSFPDTGVTFNVKDGQVVSTSPWFSNAPTSVMKDGKELNLNYNLNIGSRLDILVNPSFLLGLDSKVYGIDFSMRGGLTPSTQFFLEVDSVGRVNPDNNTSYIEANIDPRLVPKTFFAIKAKKVLSFAKVWAEVFTENHQEIKNDNPDVFQSELRDNTYFSLGFDSILNLKKMKLNMGASYLKNTTSDVLNTNEMFRFSEYIFSDALESHLKLSFFPIKLVVDFNFKYDLAESAFLASPRITYQNEQKMQFYTQYDLMGRTQNLDSDGFLATQAGNDRLMVGLNYVF